MKRFGFLAVLGCLAPMWACGQSEMEALAQRRWFEARTAHFRIYSCGITQEVAKVAARLEQFREAYSLLAGAQAVSSPPIVVIAFPDEATMEPFLPLYQGRPASLTAFFNRGSDENLIVLPLGKPFSLELIFHEYTHLLLRHNDRIWPLWLKEGMAEIYSTFEVNGGQSARIGKPIERHIRLLAGKPLLPLKQLFAVDHKSPEYNEREHQGIFYAQSWLLTHYLMLGNNGVLKTRFGQYTTLLREGQGSEQAFTNSMRSPLPVLEAGLRAYLQAAKFQPYQFSLNTDLNAARAFVTRPLAPVETCFHLGDELLRVGRSDAATEFFERARKLAPQSPLGYEGLGIVAAEAKQSDVAARFFEEASQRGSTNFLALYLHAREKYRLTTLRPDTYAAVSKEGAVEIRDWLEQSLKLMPDFGPAHHLLGFFEMVQGDDFGSAESHLQRAIQLEPENQAYLLSLAQVQLIHKGPEAARRTLAPLLLPHVESDLRAHAQQLIQEMGRPQERSR
jgi:tetratricopeptide (TPR) repeat protein